MIHVTEVTPISIGYLVLGGFVVLFSMVSLPFKERLYIGEVVLGTGFGIIIGPHCAGIFDPRSWGSTLETQNRITLEVMRVVLAVGLFAIGVELPKAYLAEHIRSLLVTVVPTMAFGWLVIAGIIRALFPALTFVSALVICACLTPTDPVLAAAIIGGKFAIKNVPVHIRRLLGAESAANDGLAYPFLSISIYLATETSKKAAFGKWFLVGWLYQVILGTVLGAVLGLAFAHFLRFAHRKDLIDRESFVAQYLALAIFTIGIANSLGSDDLLAAFAAGSAVSWDGHFNARTEDEVFSSVIDLLLNCACFVYIGAWLPFETYNDTQLGIDVWRLIVLFIAILALRRIPSLLLLYKFVPDIHNWREALFCGHFGPMGVGAIYISTLAVTELPSPNYPPATQNELLASLAQPIVSFVVLGSIIIHGLSIPAFWFGKKGTLSLTSSISRTWTRPGTSTPDWLMSARRATRSEMSGPDSLGSPSRYPGDIERVGTPKGKGKAQPFENMLSAQVSRAGSIIANPEGDLAIVGEGPVANGSGGKHTDMQDTSGEEVAGFGYAALHNASENTEGDEQRNGADAGKAAMVAEEEAPKTVHFQTDSIPDEGGEGEGEGEGNILQIPGGGIKQVQFAE